MASCEDGFEITKFSCYLAEIYGTKLTMHMGSRHDYLGMDMEFTKEGTLKVSMILYLQNVIANFPEVITGKAATPAMDYLFNVQDDKEARLLDKEQAVAFHHMVAQVLFMSTRAWRDIQTAVAFLTTRMKAPDEDAWGKLKWVLKFLNGMRPLKLTVSIITWDCQNGTLLGPTMCTGTVENMVALFTMGKGGVSSYSRKIKLNSKSLTEMELVLADMYMPELLWSLHFIQEQGYECK